ncbi:MAG: DNA/RNA non-specific endonuclease [Nitrosospira sp.]|nr:DNA/RNA non-specific endonuclease [Nitrosospira sp.]
MLIRKLAAIAVLSAVAGTAAATTTINASNCASNGQLYTNTAPRIVNSRLAKHTYRICFTAFNTMYSGVAKQPLWSAEHLTGKRIAAHRGIERHGRFHNLKAIPERYQNPLSAYTHNHYDRGHMAPAGDMPTKQAMHESFTMANMTAQWRVGRDSCKKQPNLH